LGIALVPFFFSSDRNPSPQSSVNKHLSLCADILYHLRMAEMLDRQAQIETSNRVETDESPLRAVANRLREELQELEEVWDRSANQGHGNCFALAKQIQSKRRDLELLQTILVGE
jgi:RNA polymerase-binding transcription factor DksA